MTRFIIFPKFSVINLFFSFGLIILLTLRLAGQESQANKWGEDAKDKNINNDQEIEIPVYRDRDHIENLLRLTTNSEESSYLSQKQSVLNELVNTYKSVISTLEKSYKFQEFNYWNSTINDEDINSKPIVLFLGPWSTGKSTLINYLLNLNNSSYQLYTGAEPTTSEFTIITHGTKFKSLDGKVLASTYQFNDLEKFGHSFLEHLKGSQMPRSLLTRMIMVDAPGLMENRKQQERSYPFNQVINWFIDKASLIIITFDPFRLDVGSELEGIFGRLRGKESKMRIILNKADSVTPRELMRLYGALMWNVAPLLRSVEPPRVYVGSFWPMAYKGGVEQKSLLIEEERAFLNDLNRVLSSSIDAKISLVRRHARMVLVHATLIDRFLETFSREKTFFGDNEEVWKNILNRPEQYKIFNDLNRPPYVMNDYDLPKQSQFEQFFKEHPIAKFVSLSSQCRFVWGCPADALKEAIGSTLPKLLGKNQKLFGADDATGEFCSNKDGMCL